MSTLRIPDSAFDGQGQFARARQILERGVADHVFPGAAYGVLHRRQLIAHNAVGRFTYAPDSAVVRPGTVYDLASLTKVLATTAAAMLLYDRGRLDLDTRLGDILPGFVIGMEPGSGKEKVTLRMLLAHSSGLPGYARLFEQHSRAEGLLRAALRLPLEALPGTRAEYSDIGFILLGKAIEVLAGECLARLCERDIFAPLKLESFCFSPPISWRDAIPPTEEDRTWRHRIIQGEVQDENCAALGGAAGHAGLFGNVADILRFAAVILGDSEKSPARPLFRPETIELFATRQTQPAGTSRALGWDTPSAPSSSGNHFGPRSIGHLGYSGTSLWIDPDQDLAVVLLTNRTWPDRGNQAIKQLRPAFHDAIVESL